VAVVLERDPDGRDVWRRCSSSGSLAARVTPWGLWLVGASAQPIGGDRLSVRVGVGDGAALTVRSAAATLARRGAGGRGSQASTACEIGARGTLCWLPEPTIVAAGAQHHCDSTVVLARGARLAWLESVCLGRAGEAPGTWSCRFRARDRAGTLVASDLAMGPGAAWWSSPHVLAGATALASLVVVDPARPESSWAPAWAERAGVRGCLLPLAGTGAQVTAWGPSHRSCLALVAELLDQAGPPAWLPSPLLAS
jgi:urease accessory protein